MQLRSQYDREILKLAVPALGALAAEPLYLLVDTAVVGHLGAVPLAGLAVGGVVLAQVAGLGTFLAYGTTARAARHHGAGGDVTTAADQTVTYTGAETVVTLPQ